MITHRYPFGRLALSAVLATVFAATLGGCVIATDTRPATAGEAGGASFCEKSSDGSSVACGGRATYCESSSDGRHVACGGLATFCQKSSNGEDVACGGKASYCEKSNDGKKVACGGGERRG